MGWIVSVNSVFDYFLKDVKFVHYLMKDTRLFCTLIDQTLERRTKIIHLYLDCGIWMLEVKEAFKRLKKHATLEKNETN